MIYKSLSEAMNAGAVHVVEVDTKVPDDGTDLTGTRFLDLHDFKHSSDPRVVRLRRALADARRLAREFRPEVLDLTCGLSLVVYWRNGKAQVGAHKNDEHQCDVVGFGGHGRGHVHADTHGPQPSGEPSQTDRPPQPLDELETDPSRRGRYFPAVSEVDGKFCYRVNLTLDQKQRHVDCRRIPARGHPVDPGSTYYYMHAERLMVHLLRRAGLLRLAPLDRTLTRDIAGEQVLVQVLCLYSGQVVAM